MSNYDQSQLTADDLKWSIQEIERNKVDSEKAHALEDHLREQFIKHVKDTGDERLSAMAREVLKTKNISFGRWCS